MNRQPYLGTPEMLHVSAWRDPSCEAVGHRPGSPYVEAVVLCTIGPASAWCWQRLARVAPASRCPW